MDNTKFNIARKPKYAFAFLAFYFIRFILIKVVIPFLALWTFQIEYFTFATNFTI